MQNFRHGMGLLMTALWLLANGEQAHGQTFPAFRTFLATEIAKWTKVIETAGIREQ
jgi:hypothetical protein